MRAALLALPRSVNYTPQWLRWEWFADHHGYCALPAHPDDVDKFIDSLLKDDLKASTVRGYTAAIKWVHVLNNLKFEKSELLKGFSKALGQRDKGAQVQKEAFVIKELKQMIGSLDKEKWRGARNAAMMALAFFGMFRKSEVGRHRDWPPLLRKHVVFEKDKFILTLPRSKERSTLFLWRSEGVMMASALIAFSSDT